MLSADIARIASRSPDAIAVYYNDEPISYAQFHADISRLAVWLRYTDRAFRPTAGLRIRNTYVAWLLVFALDIHGVDAFALPSHDVNYECLIIRTVFFDTSDDLNAFSAETRRVMVPSLSEIRSIEYHIDAQANRLDGKLFLSTSGTTGGYKFIAYDRAYARLVADNAGISDRDILYTIFFGMWTATGTMRLIATWLMGGAVIIDLRPDALQHLFRRRFTMFVIMPGIVKFIAATGRTLPSDCDPPRVWIAGGPTSRAVLMEARRIFGSGVRLGYSCTEAGPLLLESEENNDDDLRVFRAGQGRQIEVVDENGRRCAVGEQGFLRIRLEPGNPTGYVNDAEASSKAFRDGYFWPGDLAEQRGDGTVRILGRQSDVVIMNGGKLPARPLEEALASETGAEDCCLFSHIHSDGTTVLLAAIQGAKTHEAIVAAVLKRLLPGFDDFCWEFLDAFPQRGIGKPDRAALRRLLEYKYSSGRMLEPAA
jgi:acyl-coenzyme A synthetase/AMP-(fatty) acid ligase